MQRLSGQKSFPVSMEPVHCPGWWYSLPQNSQRLCMCIQAQPERKNITVGLVSCKGNSVLGAFWVASAPCRSWWPRGQTHLCVLMPVLWSRSSLWRGKGHCCVIQQRSWFRSYRPSQGRKMNLHFSPVMMVMSWYGKQSISSFLLFFARFQELVRVFCQKADFSPGWGLRAHQCWNITGMFCPAAMREQKPLRRRKD